MTILQILPRVPPAICGIGDYSWRLAQALRDEQGIHSSFLSAGTSWTEPAQRTEFPVFRLAQLRAQTLVDFIAKSSVKYQAIVLHMSPYGYQKRAVPLWLANGWKQISNLGNRPILFTMFHELYASGSIRTSAFWLKPVQKMVLRSVALASDVLRTNRMDYAKWLKKLTDVQADDVLAMPVFSNFGEPAALPRFTTRPAAMVIFGWGIHSGESLDSVIRKACTHCEHFGLTTLHIIGGGHVTVHPPHSVTLVRHGFLSPEAVSAILLNCRMAYTAYSADHFGKSTLMAAFAAHGLAVVVQGKGPILPDGLEDQRNVINERSLIDEGYPNEAKLGEIGESLHLWYSGHSLTRNAASFAAQLKKQNRRFHTEH